MCIIEHSLMMNAAVMDASCEEHSAASQLEFIVHIVLINTE